MGFTALFPPIAGMIVWPKLPVHELLLLYDFMSKPQIGISGQWLLSAVPDSLFDRTVRDRRICNFEGDFAKLNELDQALHLGRLDDLLH